jgi:hypothetical protein
MGRVTIVEFLRDLRRAWGFVALNDPKRRRLLAELDASGLMDDEQGIASKLSSKRLIELFDLGVFRDDRQFLLWSPSDGSGGLAELFERYDSDKGASNLSQRQRSKKTHSYVHVYEALLGPLRADVRSVVEIGIGYPAGTFEADRKLAGGSLRVWRDYFPNANIYGGDINSSALFSDERIWTHQVDQLDAVSVGSFLEELPEGPIDVVIDDGLHEFEANRILLETVLPRLSEKSVYFIEDCQPVTRELFRDYFADREADGELRVDYYSGLRFDRYRTKDDTLIVIRKRNATRAA